MTTTQVSQKVCTACDVPKDFSEFYKQKNGKYGLKGKCKSCYGIVRNSFWRNKSAEEKREAKRVYTLKSRYGLTPDELVAIFMDQDGKCAICGSPSENEGYLGIGLYIDHDHKTDEVRGLLCNLCNVGLGSFRDNPVNLENAIKYLNKFNDKEL